MTALDVRRGAILVVLVLTASLAAPAIDAAPRGLFRVEDFSGIYWADRFGVSHKLSGTSLIDLYFKGEPIRVIAWDEFEKTPKGGPLTETIQPQFYDTATSKVTVETKEPKIVETRTEIKEPTVVQKKTEIVTELGAAPVVVEEKTEVVQQREVVETRTAIDTPVLVEKVTEVTKPSTVVESRKEIQANGTVIEKTTEIKQPVVVSRTKELMKPKKVVEKSVKDLGDGKVLERKTEVESTSVIVEKTAGIDKTEKKVETQETVTKTSEIRDEDGTVLHRTVEVEQEPPRVVTSTVETSP